MPRSLKLAALLAACLLLLTACSLTVEAPTVPPQRSWRVLEELPHDPHSFTQGLELLEPGRLLESRGLYGESGLRVTELATGRVLQEAPPMGPSFFAEGVTRAGSDLYQLTWREGVAYRRDASTLEVTEELPLEGEGWGTCYDSLREVLWVSDGSSTLTGHSLEDFRRLSSVELREGRRVLEGEVNELECVEGHVWANLWHSSRVVEVDPASGQVLSSVDFQKLLEGARAASGARWEEDVLNGLAHDAETDTWLVTGKRWPKLYRVALSEPQ